MIQANSNKFNVSRPVSAVQSKRSGFSAGLAAALASSCCVVPLILSIFAVSGSAIGFFGKYHWYFWSIGVLALLYAWKVFIMERRKLYGLAIEIKSDKLTRGILLIASIIVLYYGVGNAAAFLSRSQTQTSSSVFSLNAPCTIGLKIEGMSCPACEGHVVNAVKTVPGVRQAIASYRLGEIIADCDGNVQPLDIAKAIRKHTGYTAIIEKMLLKGEQ